MPQHIDDRKSPITIILACMFFWPLGFYWLYQQSPTFRTGWDRVTSWKGWESATSIWWSIVLVCGAVSLLGLITPIMLIVALPVICILTVCLAIYGLVQDKQDNRWWLIVPLVIAGTFLALMGKSSMSSVFDEDKDK
jgi:hypothetical protein